MARTPNIVHKRPPIFGGESNYQPLTNFSNEQTIDAARQLTKTETKSDGRHGGTRGHGRHLT